jgi:hypothetical protein
MVEQIPGTSEGAEEPAADGTLKDWPERMAAKAPSFRPEQQTIIVSALTAAPGRPSSTDTSTN